MELKVLIVETIPAHLRGMENILKQAGYEKIFQAKNCKDALAILEKELDIGLVISEWDLPDAPGLEILEALKNAGRMEKTQVFLTFKDKTKEEILKALKSGARGFIVKPYKFDIVKQKLAGVALSAPGTPGAPSAPESVNDAQINSILGKGPIVQ